MPALEPLCQRASSPYRRWKRLLAAIEAQTGAPRAVLARVLEGFGELAAEIDAEPLEQKLRATSWPPNGFSPRAFDAT